MDTASCLVRKQFLVGFMSAITVSSLSLAIQEVVIPWLVAHHIFDVTVDQYVQSLKVTFKGYSRSRPSGHSILHPVSLQREPKAEVRKIVHYFLPVNCRKDGQLLSSGYLRALDFLFTLIYPPKLFRFINLLYEKREIVKKVHSR